MSKSDIVTELGIPLKRLRKYLNGDPNAVSKHGGAGKGKGSPLDEYTDTIIELVGIGMPYTDIFEELVNQGYKGRRKTLYGFCERMLGSKRRTQIQNKSQHFVLRKLFLIISGLVNPSTYTTSSGYFHYIQICLTLRMLFLSFAARWSKERKTDFCIWPFIQNPYPIRKLNPSVAV